MLEQALALAARGFPIFPCRAGSKLPAVTAWQEWATSDAEKVREHWAAHPNHNIGIFTGRGLLAVDVDAKPGGKNGHETILRLELEGLDLPPTYTQRTPTGGKHFVYSVAVPVRQGAGILGDGVDIRSRGGYIVAAGSRIGSESYDGNDLQCVPAPDWLVTRCCHPDRADRTLQSAHPDIESPGARERAIEYLRNAEPAHSGSRNDAAYRHAARVRDFGCVQGAAVELLSSGVWKCEPPLDPAELAHVVKSAYTYSRDAQGNSSPEADFSRAPDAIPPTLSSPPALGVDTVAPVAHPFEMLNREFAFCLAGGGSHILWETTDALDRRTLIHLDERSFHKKFAAKKFQTGKKLEPVTMAWMEHPSRRSYDGLTFMPGRESPARFYNLWSGFEIEPAPSNSVEPAHPAVAAWLEHAEKNICRGDTKLFRWMIGWFAHMVQKPHEKPLTALVLRGGKGVGKNAFIDCVARLLGGHALLTSNRRYLVGNFNGHLENLLLFVLDEAFWSGDKQAEGQLKDLITGSRHVIEHKGKEPYTIDNLTRIVVLGNEDWLVPASHDERRFAVFDVGDGRKQDRAFFANMRLRMEDGGYRALLRHLLNFEIVGIDINEAPNTQGLMEQKHATLEPLQAWWLNCLHDGKLIGSDFGSEWPTEIECERFRAALFRYCRERQIRTRVPDDRSIGREMAKCCPGVRRKRASKRPDGSQPYVYGIPALAVGRMEWDRYIGHPVGWVE